MDLVKKYSKMAIRTLVSSNAILLKVAESWRIISKRIGSADIFKRETLSISFSITMKAGKKSTIKSLRTSMRKEATGSTTKFNSLIGSSSTKKFKKLSVPVPILRWKLFSKENFKFLKKSNKTSFAKTTACQEPPHWGKSNSLQDWKTVESKVTNNQWENLSETSFLKDKVPQFQSFILLPNKMKGRAREKETQRTERWARAEEKAKWWSKAEGQSWAVSEKARSSKERV